MELLYLDFELGAGDRHVREVVTGVADVERCPVDSTHTWPVPPVEHRVSVDGEPNDFVFNSGGKQLIGERARALFAEHGITGYRLDQTVPANTRAGRVAPLWRFVVTGWGGMARPESGVARASGPCPGCGRTKYSPIADASRLFDATQWDGSDVFMIWPMPRRAFITARVADLVHRHRVTGVTICGVAELSKESRNFIGQRGFVAMPPSHYLGVDRGALIGSQLGFTS